MQTCNGPIGRSNRGGSLSRNGFSILCGKPRIENRPECMTEHHNNPLLDFQISALNITLEIQCAKKIATVKIACAKGQVSHNISRMFFFFIKKNVFQIFLLFLFKNALNIRVGISLLHKYISKNVFLQ